MNKKVILMLILLVAGGFAGAWKVDGLYHPKEANTYPSMVNPGDRDVLIEVQLRNTYTRSYHNITGKLVPSSPFTGVDVEAEVSRIDPNSTANIYYRVNVAPDAVPGEYALFETLDYDYYDTEATGDYTQSEISGTIHIQSKRTLIVNIDADQKVSIVDMHFEPSRILPAVETKLFVTVKNTGSITINNLDVTYDVNTDSDTVNIAPETVTKKTVDALLPGEEATVDFLMKAIDTATVQPYQVDITVSSESGTVTTRTDETVIDVVGTPDIRLAGIQTDKETIYRGLPFSVSIQFENTGTGDAKSTKVVLQDGNLTGITVSYVGEIEVDDTGSAIFDLRDTTPGKKTITAVVTYEDTYGETFTQEEEIQYIITAVSADFTMPILFFVVITGVVIWWWRARQKKKKIEKLVK